MSKDNNNGFAFKTHKKQFFGTLAVLLVVLIVAFICVRSKNNSQYHMTMYENAELMEKEIRQFIPRGSSISKAKRVMNLNDFVCNIETKNLLECEQDNSSFVNNMLSGLNNNWYVNIRLKGGVVNGVKVWIQPSD